MSQRLKEIKREGVREKNRQRGMELQSERDREGRSQRVKEIERNGVTE